jgi:quinol monooxygenase YgiN
MPQVTVVARIKAKANTIEKLREALQKLVEATLHKDDGCINYNLYQDNDNPTLFFFLENWESDELLKKHLDSDHVKAYREASKGWIEQRDLYRLTRIS